MKSQLIAIVAAAVLVGCGPSKSIHDAARDGNIEAVKPPLHSATIVAEKEVAELLIAEGADVNAKDDGCWTPLHHTFWGEQGSRRTTYRQRRECEYEVSVG